MGARKNICTVKSGTHLRMAVPLPHLSPHSPALMTESSQGSLQGHYRYYYAQPVKPLCFLWRLGQNPGRALSVVGKHSTTELLSLVTQLSWVLVVLPPPLSTGVPDMLHVCYMISRTHTSWFDISTM